MLKSRSIQRHPFFFRIKKKKGAPTRAVSTPTGNSCGAMIVLDIVSAKTKNEAPLIAAAGKSKRWSGPTKDESHGE